MNYQEAVVVVKDNYNSQATSLLNLSEEAVITLANLCQENTKRHLTENTINRLSTMEPYRQAGYIANPFMEFLMDSIIASARSSVGSSQPTTTSTTTVPSTNPKVPVKPVVAPKPDADDDVGVPFDLFN